MNIANSWRPTKGQTDIYGNEIEDRIYNNLDYDYNIILQDRVRAVAEEITNYLRQSDRMQKTIIDYTKRNVRGEFATLDNFILIWPSLRKKREIVKIFAGMGLDLQALKQELNMQDVDDFDFICHIAYDPKPMTRAEHAKKVKRSDFFIKYYGAGKTQETWFYRLDMPKGYKNFRKTNPITCEHFAPVDEW